VVTRGLGPHALIISSELSKHCLSNSVPSESEVLVIFTWSKMGNGTEASQESPEKGKSLNSGLSSRLFQTELADCFMPFPPVTNELRMHLQSH